MGESGDDSTSSVSSDVSEGSQTNVVPLSSNLTELISTWVMEGLPIFEKLMEGLFKEGVIKDPTQQLLLFNVIGGFNHHFGEAWKLEFDLQDSTTIAIGKMMANPAIGKMVESFMQNQVEENVMRRLI